MKILKFAKRTAKEILRDPLTLSLGIGFPVILILLLSAIQANVPVSIFEIDSLAPSMTVFGLSFMTLFSATLIAKDRESAFLPRLYASPMRAVDFIVGYTLPILPISIIQSALCFVLGIILGLDVTVNILFSLIFIIPISFLFLGLGLLFGSILTQKQVGGICGTLITNLTAWLSGIWFDLSLVGGAFEKIAGLLPFYHAVELEKAAYSGNFDNITQHLLWVVCYAVFSFALAIFFFIKQMREN